MIYLIEGYKGYSIGYEQNGGDIRWFVIEPTGKRAEYTGEWAAQAARLHFMNGIERIFDEYFKKKFAALGINATGYRKQISQPENDG
jgi:hypothetical protein